MIESTTQPRTADCPKQDTPDSTPINLSVLTHGLEMGRVGCAFLPCFPIAHDFAPVKLHSSSNGALRQPAARRLHAPYGFPTAFWDFR
jgi:hypothetical protein